MRRGLLCLALAGLLAPSSRADVVLTQGLLQATVQSSNGALSQVSYNGTEFYRNGLFVSDFGFQVGTNTGTFRVNDAYGRVGVPVTVSGTTTPTVTGTFNGVNFSRVYSLVAGTDVLRTSTSLTNTTGSAITIRLFDTFDPDQGTSLGLGASTVNDVYGLAGQTVARSTVSTGLSVVYGNVVPGPGVLGFGGGTSPFGLGISDGNSLNTFFTSPFDPNGASSDIGFAVAREFTLAAGASVSFRFDQAFGTTQANAEAALLAAAAPVPEPATIATFGLMAVGGLAARRRMRRA
jgi:hypothetical protein